MKTIIFTRDTLSISLEDFRGMVSNLEFLAEKPIEHDENICKLFPIFEERRIHINILHTCVPPLIKYRVEDYATDNYGGLVPMGMEEYTSNTLKSLKSSS